LAWFFLVKLAQDAP
jgi:hypothetical protein